MSPLVAALVALSVESEAMVALAGAVASTVLAQTMQGEALLVKAMMGRPPTELHSEQGAGEGEPAKAASNPQMNTWVDQEEMGSSPISREHRNGLAGEVVEVSTTTSRVPWRYRTVEVLGVEEGAEEVATGLRASVVSFRRGVSMVKLECRTQVAEAEAQTLNASQQAMVVPELLCFDTRALNRS